MHFVTLHKYGVFYMGKVSDVIDARLLELGIKGSKMCDDLGISRSTLTELRKGRASTLKAERAVLIADYLGISVSQLLGNEQNEKPAPTDGDGLTEADRRDIAEELEQLMAEMTQGGDLMFDGDPATPEAMESLRNAMEMGLTYAKKVNKDKLGK